MKVRVILVCTLLLLAASSLFAAPPCRYCDYFSNDCVSAPYSGEVCWRTVTGCEGDFGYCIGRSDTTVLTEWKVASIEISRPSLDSITVTAPVQQAAAEVRTAEPAEKK